MLRDHPAIGSWIVGPFVPSEVAHAVRHHHERFDGQGYPAGLGAADLPWMTRAVTVADAYDALVSRASLPGRMLRAARLRELHRVVGTQPDGELVEVLIGAVTSRELAPSLVA